MPYLAGKKYNMGLLWFLFCIFIPEVFEQISPELHVASTQKCLLPLKYGHDPDWKGLHRLSQPAWTGDLVLVLVD